MSVTAFSLKEMDFPSICCLAKQRERKDSIKAERYEPM